MWYATVSIVVFVFCAALAAEEIYTWTDAAGVTHISSGPPPPDARQIEVIEYAPQSPSEMRAIRQRQEALAARYHQEALREEARNVRRQAEQARNRAAAATAAADDAERRLAEFRRKVGNTTRRRQLNRSAILRLETNAATARKAALEAAQAAERAEKKAVEAAKRAAVSPEGGVRDGDGTRSSSEQAGKRQRPPTTR